MALCIGAPMSVLAVRDLGAPVPDEGFSLTLPGMRFHTRAGIGALPYSAVLNVFVTPSTMCVERPIDSVLVWLKGQQKGAKCKHSVCINSVEKGVSRPSGTARRYVFRGIALLTSQQFYKPTDQPPPTCLISTKQSNTAKAHASLQASHTIGPTAAFTVYCLQHPKVSQLVTLMYMPDLQQLTAIPVQRYEKTDGPTCKY